MDHSYYFWLRGLKELIKCRWREFIREPSAAIFVVLMPILMMVVLGFALDKEKEASYGIGWVSTPENLERNSLDHPWFLALKSDPRMRIRVGERSELEQAMRHGDIVLWFESDSGLKVSYDPKNPQAQKAWSYANDTIQRAGGRRDPVSIVFQAIDLTGGRYVDFLVPGLLAMSIMSTSLFGTGMLIVANRREHLLKRYLATPMRPWQYILSHVVGRGFMLFVEVASLLTAARLIFQFKLEGNLFEFSLILALGAGSFTAFAMLCGSRTSNAAVMNGMTNIISLPMLLMSGAWFSRAHFPEWLMEMTRWLPLTALVESLRRIALEGVGLHSLSFEIIVLVSFGVLSAAGASRLFKWY